MAAVFAFLVLVVCAIPIEHLAFARHPRFAGSELWRRAIGITTVMLLALIPVAWGGLDWRTWAVLLAGFLAAGAVLGGMVWLERRQERAARMERARREVHEQLERYFPDHAETDQ